MSIKNTSNISNIIIRNAHIYFTLNRERDENEADELNNISHGLKCRKYNAEPETQKCWIRDKCLNQTDKKKSIYRERESGTKKVHLKCVKYENVSKLRKEATEFCFIINSPPARIFVTKKHYMHCVAKYCRNQLKEKLLKSINCRICIIKQYTAMIFLQELVILHFILSMDTYLHCNLRIFYDTKCR